MWLKAILFILFIWKCCITCVDSLITDDSMIVWILSSGMWLDLWVPHIVGTYPQTALPHIQQEFDLNTLVRVLTNTQLMYNQHLQTGIHNFIFILSYYFLSLRTQWNSFMWTCMNKFIHTYSNVSICITLKWIDITVLSKTCSSHNCFQCQHVTIFIQFLLFEVGVKFVLFFIDCSVVCYF